RKKEEDERRERAKSGSVNKPEDVLLNIATSPDGNWLATAGKDGNIYLWNIKDLLNKQVPKISLIKTLTGAGAVQRLAFSPDSNLLASVGQDSAVHLWDLEHSTWHELISQPLLGHKVTINALAFYTDPQNKLLRLATADSKGVTKIWRIPLSEKLHKLQYLMLKLGAENSANGDLEPLIKEVRQFIE